MKYRRCSNCRAMMRPVSRGYECRYCGNILLDGTAGQNYRKKHFGRYYMPAVSGVLILLGILLPWYQKKEDCRILLWEMNTVSDSMGLLKGMHQILQGRYYIWLILFSVCLAFGWRAFAKADFRRMPAIMLLFLCLLIIAFKASPPDSYMKAGAGRAFMSAGFAVCLASWRAIVHFS